MAARGAAVTVLDYSPVAIDASKAFFQRNDVAAEFIHADVLALPEAHKGQFDIVMSFGLAEHFRNPERTNVVSAHFDLVRRGGGVLISAPNRHNLPYRFYKFVAERTGRWKVGEEYPFSRSEFVRMCKQLGITDYEFLADSVLESARFVSPLHALRKLRKAKVSARPALPATPLDEYVAYALVLAAIRP
jgi:2-polyprenyl-3-methyl-5-hydroxy-6-metoxy-1,4-benzoquinol methylase